VFDCVLSDWGDWGACSASCDAGFRVRTRNILVDGTCGGIPCAHTRETKSCFRESCPCKSLRCVLEHHKCPVGAQRDFYAFPQHGLFHKARLYDECDGRTHYTIRVHHDHNEHYGSGHHCWITNQATGECKCRCHDEYRHGVTAFGDFALKLEPTAVKPVWAPASERSHRMPSHRACTRRGSGICTRPWLGS
jgi:hypothetical protein